MEANIFKSNKQDLICDLETLSEVLGQEDYKYEAKKIETNILKAKLEAEASTAKFFLRNSK